LNLIVENCSRADLIDPTELHRAIVNYFAVDPLSVNALAHPDEHRKSANAVRKLRAKGA
jgi:hypothetical protein